MQALLSQLETTLTPAVSGLGYELLCLEFQGSGDNAVLRLYIDAADGIGVEDCARVSREVSALLDVEDPIAQGYRLEVSSPGLDRPLVTPAHFRQFIGQEAKVRLHASQQERRNFRGEILSCDNSQLQLRVDGEVFDLALNDIERARLVPRFEEA